MCMVGGARRLTGNKENEIRRRGRGFEKRQKFVCRCAVKYLNEDHCESDNTLRNCVLWQGRDRLSGSRTRQRLGFVDLPSPSPELEQRVGNVQLSLE